MAEGHAVHGMARRVRQLVGQPGRGSGPACAPEPDGAGLPTAAVVMAAEAHGKHLLIHLGSDGQRGDLALHLHLHLGMHGRVSVRRHRRALAEDGLPRTDPPPPQGLAWRLLTGSFVLDISRPTVCELLDASGLEALHARLGPDPLRDDADPQVAVSRLRRSRRPIGQLLIDQSVVSGIGNVYRAELLWRAGLGPHTLGRDVPVETLEHLWQDTVELMGIGLGAGWIVAEEGQVAAARELLVRGEVVPRWPKRYAVYGRRGAPCPRCGASVVAERMGLQTMYWCPGCQPTLPAPGDD